MENKFIRADDVAQELSVSKPYGKGIISSPALPYQPKKKTSQSAYGGNGTNAICKSIKEQPTLICSQAES